MTFTYWGRKLTELDHPYNDTARNERAVEIPVALHFLDTVKGDGLEVGNVLGHYGCTRKRVVVDLHEHGDNVANIDIRDVTVRDLPWIVSVSTVEHVGWDDDSDPTAAVDTLERLRSFLAPDGRMLVTVPLGYNPPLDAHLLHASGAMRCCTLVRDPWRQTDEMEHRPYIGDGHGAGAVWIGEYGG